MKGLTGATKLVSIPKKADSPKSVFSHLDKRLRLNLKDRNIQFFFSKFQSESCFIWNEIDSTWNLVMNFSDFNICNIHLTTSPIECYLSKSWHTNHIWGNTMSAARACITISSPAPISIPEPFKPEGQRIEILSIKQNEVAEKSKSLLDKLSALFRFLEMK